MNTYHWDQWGDPRNLAEEARQILDGSLPMRPSEEQLRAISTLTIGVVPCEW